MFLKNALKHQKPVWHEGLSHFFGGCYLTQPQRIISSTNTISEFRFMATVVLIFHWLRWLLFFWLPGGFTTDELPIKQIHIVVGGKNWTCYLQQPTFINKITQVGSQDMVSAPFSTTGLLYYYTFIILVLQKHPSL